MQVTHSYGRKKVYNGVVEIIMTTMVLSELNTECNCELFEEEIRKELFDLTNKQESFKNKCKEYCRKQYYKGIRWRESKIEKSENSFKMKFTLTRKVSN